MVEMTLVAATLLKRFDICLTPGANAPELDVTMALRPKEALSIRWQRRNTSTAHYAEQSKP
jgi:cytochrome P450